MNLTTALAALEGAVADLKRIRDTVPAQGRAGELLAHIQTGMAQAAIDRIESVLAAAKSEAVSAEGADTVRAAAQRLVERIRENEGLLDTIDRDDDVAYIELENALEAEPAPTPQPSPLPLPAEVREAVERLGRIADDPNPYTCDCGNLDVSVSNFDTIRTHLLGDGAAGATFDFHAHLCRQREWSARTFGPGDRAAGVVDHIRKELREIEADPADLSEWIDVVILALDGAWRSGADAEQIIEALTAKQAKNEARSWPDWRTQPADKAIEHVKPVIADGSCPTCHGLGYWYIGTRKEPDRCPTCRPTQPSPPAAPAVTDAPEPLTREDLVSLGKVLRNEIRKLDKLFEEAFARCETVPPSADPAGAVRESSQSVGSVVHARASACVVGDGSNARRTRCQAREGRG